MNPPKLRRLVGTRILLAGTKLNLANPATINLLKENKITKVFCLYPLKQEQLETLKNGSKEMFHTIEGFYKAHRIDPSFIEKLSANNIRAVSLIRGPRHLREYESFAKEALQTRQSFLVQCYIGKHGSAAYAMYYLAAVTPLTLKQIEGIFLKSGWTKKDIEVVKETLTYAKVYVKRVVERKLKKIKEAADKIAGKKVKKRKKKMTRQPYKRKKKRRR